MLLCAASDASGGKSCAGLRFSGIHSASPRGLQRVFTVEDTPGKPQGVRGVYAPIRWTEIDLSRFTWQRTTSRLPSGASTHLIMTPSLSAVTPHSSSQHICLEHHYRCLRTELNAVRSLALVDTPKRPLLAASSICLQDVEGCNREEKQRHTEN